MHKPHKMTGGGHSHTMHKPHKMTGGGHKRAQAQEVQWAQPLANAVTPSATHTSDASATKLQHHGCRPKGGDVLHSNAIAVVKLGHTANFCRNKRQIHGGDDLGNRGKDFCGGVPMKVSSLETTDKFNVLTTEET